MIEGARFMEAESFQCLLGAAGRLFLVTVTVIGQICPEVFIYLFFKRACKELISFIQLAHTVGAASGYVERHAARIGDLLGCGEVQGMEDAGGAEKADGERIGLLFRFSFAGKFLDARIFGIFQIVSEEHVAELMGESEAADGDRLGIVVYDDPVATVGEGFALFSG